MSTLQATDANEVEVMLSIQEARSNFYLERFQNARGKGDSAEVATATALTLLMEEKFSI